MTTSFATSHLGRKITCSAINITPLRFHATNLPRSGASHIICRNASVDSAIYKGLRKSKNVGFRGREIGSRERDDRRDGGDEENRMGRDDGERRGRGGYGGVRGGRGDGDFGRSGYGGREYRRDGERSDMGSSNGRGASYMMRGRDTGSRNFQDNNHSSNRYEEPTRGGYRSSGDDRRVESSSYRDVRPERRESRYDEDRDPYHRRKQHDFEDDKREKYPLRKSYSNDREKEPHPSNTSPSTRFEPTTQSPPRHDKQIPLSIPYTTPASEFLYGTSSVEAALRTTHPIRRKLYKLYIYSGENRNSSTDDPTTPSPNKDIELERLAKRQHIPVVKLRNDKLPLMDKMSAGRPHNGYILECSPLPQLPIKSLGTLAPSNSVEPGFTLHLAHQSREAKAINGESNFIPMIRASHGNKKFPLVLLLDSIKDPGNLGAIIRTANFLGVDAIVQTARGSAPLTQVAVKASAGASENMTLCVVKDVADGDFVRESRRNGWAVYAAVAPALETGFTDSGGRRGVQKPSMGTLRQELGVEDVSAELEKGPCLLLLGSEGMGLRNEIKREAGINVVIAGSAGRAGVDSLNVSVAAALLCYGFLGKGGSDGGRKGSVPVHDEEEKRIF